MQESGWPLKLESKWVKMTVMVKTISWKSRNEDSQRKTRPKSPWESYRTPFWKILPAQMLSSYSQIWPSYQICFSDAFKVSQPTFLRTLNNFFDPLDVFWSQKTPQNNPCYNHRLIKCFKFSYSMSYCGNESDIR